MEALPNPVKIVEECRVGPMPPALSAPGSLPLTIFDLLWLRFPSSLVIQRLFFYELPPHLGTAAAFSETVLPKLKQSLSLTLQTWTLLAGNLAWPQSSDKPLIQYSDGDAVSLTVAEYGADFHRLSDKSSFREATEYHSHLPDLPSSHARVPVLALQVTLFPNSGFSVGYSAHHVVVDGKTLSMFMNSWASICSSSNSMADQPFYGRAFLSEDQERAMLNRVLDQGGPNNKSVMLMDLKSPGDAAFVTFQLTRANIETLKNWVRARLDRNQQTDVHLSNFTAISAFVWVCLIKLHGMRGGEKAQLMFAADCRGRLDPPVPSTYFGNCVVGCCATADVDGLLGEDGVAMAAKVIGEAIDDLKHADLKAAQDLIFGRASTPTSLDKVFTIAGSPRFEFYKVDFGWGRPRKVEVISIDRTGALSLSDSGDGTAIVEIGLAPKKDKVADFASLFASGLEAFARP
ncbi:phenolic glucoside malonyltransferase 2-like [Diospyros lotus]|uniref:phenolic glucoside malonyltransferase 2-like n=1 Tax=Diospyros lotus TaxID=55363 RepID=UPI00224FA302|nr:phenolic glucoside malonyltransferase 2-like [Diospyros lotus]